MRALIIQHDHLCTPGFVGERLIERGFELVVHVVVPEADHRSPGVSTDFPDPTGFDLVVAFGSPWSVVDPAIASWVDPELALLRRADAAGVPVLGICFGGQLLAAAHGGSVARAEASELGWYAVSIADDAMPDGPWLQWHFDCWTVPPGAVELARSPAASQAFRLRRNLALQFHPEVDEQILRGWLDPAGKSDVANCGVDPTELLAETRGRVPDSRIRAHRLVDAFLDGYLPAS